MRARIEWLGGGDAWVVSLDAGAIVLRSTVPAPPGARIVGVLDDASASPVRVKVHASRRQPEGDFVLQGRPLNMPREIRERIGQLMCDGPSPEQPAETAAAPTRGTSGLS